MALSKLSRKRRWLIKYLLAEEIEDEELILQMYGRKRAKMHLMFELRNEEGVFQTLITNHLHKDLILLIRKPGSHDVTDTHSFKSTIVCGYDYIHHEANDGRSRLLLQSLGAKQSH